MLEMLPGHIAVKSEDIKRIEYKYLAPLYAEEPIRLCGKEWVLGEYETWTEGSNGGLAVKGMVKTIKI